MPLILIIPGLIALAAQGQPSVPKNQELLEHLDPSPETTGCGLYFSLADAKGDDPPLVFWWGFGPEGALVKVSGKVHRLEQDGDDWADAKVRVRLDYRVMKVVYEGENLQGTLTLTVGKIIRKYRIKGYKGC